MKGNKRRLYLELSKEIDASLCCFCRYGIGCDFGSSICDGSEGYYECNHPVDNLSYSNIHEIDCLPGDDCIGFSPSFSVPLLTEMASLILSNKFTEWGYSVKDNILDLQLAKREGDVMRFYKAEISIG